MLILNNIINESKYKIIKNKNGIYLTFNKEDETDFDIIVMKKAYNLKDIVVIENIEYLIESYNIEGMIITFCLVNNLIK